MAYIPPEIYRYIRSYLPPQNAHHFREVRKDLKKFEDWELAQIYSKFSPMELVEIGDVMGLEYLLSHGQIFDLDLINVLYTAITKNHLSMVKYLISKWPHTKEMIAYFPIMLTIMSGNVRMAKFLLENGVSLHNWSEPRLLVAIKTKNIDMVKLILEYLPDFFELLNTLGLSIAAENMDLPMIKFLVELGVTNDNPIALNRAISNCSLPIVKYLIHHGAKADIISLELAVECGIPDIIELIVDQLSIDDSLKFAISTKNLQLVKLLLERCSHITGCSDKALKLAAEYGDLKIVEWLVDNGANIENSGAIRAAIGREEIRSYLINKFNGFK